MSESIHFKLAERLNEFPIKLMLIDAYIDILREFYTEEEAQLGSELPTGSYSASELAEQLDREEKALTDLLETMADKGMVFVAKTDDGLSKYALIPFVPGVWEFQLMRGNDTPKDRKIAKMLQSFMDNDMGPVMAEAMQDPVVAKQLMPDAACRTITVEQELPKGTEIYPFEKLIDLIEGVDFISAQKCYCRHQSYLVDEPCKVENVPEYSCLMFGKPAEYVVDRGFGKRISREECLEIIEATEKAGLIHTVNNFLERMVFICNCCGCCCEFLKSLKMFGNNAMIAASNFGLQVNAEECTGCEECIERCQMEALSLNKDEVITVDEVLCVGCGNCVSECPTECLSMVRKSDEKPPAASPETLGVGI